MSTLRFRKSERRRERERERARFAPTKQRTTTTSDRKTPFPAPSLHHYVAKPGQPLGSPFANAAPRLSLTTATHAPIFGSAARTQGNSIVGGRRYGWEGDRATRCGFCDSLGREGGLDARCGGVAELVRSSRSAGWSEAAGGYFGLGMKCFPAWSIREKEAEGMGIGDSAV